MKARLQPPRYRDGGNRRRAKGAAGRGVIGARGDSELEAAAGFEPANTGFANRRLGPLGYAAPD